MFSTSEPSPGKLHLLQWPSEMAKTKSFRGGALLDQAQLVIASPDLPEVATCRVPSETTVIHLPSGVPGPSEAALALVRQSVLDGYSVVWLQGKPGVISLRDANSPAGRESEIEHWCVEQGIECATHTVGDLSSRPLAKSWALLPRPRHQVAQTVEQLHALGATVVSQPAIKISQPTDLGPLDAALGRIESYDWLVFSSVNGVHYFINRLWACRRDLRQLGNVKLAAIGPSTAEALGEYRLQADMVPNEYRAEALAEALSSEVRGKRILLARASRGREVLAEQLLAVGAEVDQVAVYESADACPTELQQQPVLWLLDEGRLDWTMVTSTAIARSLVQLFGERLKQTRLVSISPITSDALRKLGLEPAVEAKEYTLAGMIEAMVHHTE